MPTIETGRRTHDYTGDMAVFLIGVRFNKLYRVDLWWPVFTAMPKMLTELYRNRAEADDGTAADLGFLGARTLVGGKGLTVIQYWRSVEDIYRYASDADRSHRPAWSAFNRRVRRGAHAVGIWHETFAVPASGHESVYVDMPAFGLSRATASVTPAGSKTYAKLRAASS